MPFDCQHRLTHGQDVCVTACPTTGAEPTFAFARVERGGALPPVDETAIDLALLDMHHGWPNLGHDAIAYGIQNIVCDLTPALRDGRAARAGAVVRRAPRASDSRASGTAAPDLRRHRRPGPSRSAAERRRVARLAGHRRGPGLGGAAVRAVRRHPRRRRRGAAGGVSHLRRDVPVAGHRRCRAARAEKGGKSSGIVDNVLTDAALDASLVQPPGARAAGSATAEDPRQPAVRPDPAGRRPAVGRRRAVVRGAGRVRTSWRRAHGHRGRTRSVGHDAAHPRREPSPRDRQPVAPD